MQLFFVENSGFIGIMLMYYGTRFDRNCLNNKNPERCRSRIKNKNMSLKMSFARLTEFKHTEKHGSWKTWDGWLFRSKGP